MRLAIMQPYFLPYIGYFQLIAAVDEIVIYDNIQYTKKGWINRNRMLRNGEDVTFTVPLQKDSDYLDIRQRYVADTFDREKLLAQIDGAYRRAPNFAETFPLIEDIVRHAEKNLFAYLFNSLTKICEHLGITTSFRISSDLKVDHELVGQDKVLAICTELGAQTYVNLPGGKDLYDNARFDASGIDLKFIEPKKVEYQQFGNGFVPNLSILDVLMFNDLNSCRALVEDYGLAE